MTSKSVFISRYVYSNSPLCIDANYTLAARSLIKFEQVSIDAFPMADWYFFYSRNGVYFGLRQLADRSVLDGIQIATMGKGTAQQFQSMQGRTPDFIGSGDAEHVAAEFIKVAEGKKVTFIRAQNSLNSIKINLKGRLDASELITYHNTINSSASIPSTDVAIFTSPMNVDAYFQNKTVDAASILIALGRSTKKAILKYTDTDVQMPDEPSEYSIRVLLDSILAT